MPQVKTVKKKSTAKVGGGGVGTRVSKLNLKIVIPIVVIVAALGGFYIFKKSSAGSAYSLTGDSVMRKEDGRYYQTTNDGVIGSSWEKLPRTATQVCALVRPMDVAYSSVQMHIFASTDRPYSSTQAVSTRSKSLKTGVTSELCTPAPAVNDNYVNVAKFRVDIRDPNGIYNPNTFFGVNSVYTK